MNVDLDELKQICNKYKLKIIGVACANWSEGVRQIDFDTKLLQSTNTTVYFWWIYNDSYMELYNDNLKRCSPKIPLHSIEKYLKMKVFW